MIDEVKPCPFCGQMATLEHNDPEQSKINMQLITTKWRVLCSECGVATGWHKSIYRITLDAKLEITDPRNDGRAHAINTWNARC